MINVIKDKKIVRCGDVGDKLFRDKVALFMFTNYVNERPDESQGFVACTYDYEGELVYKDPELRRKFRELPFGSMEIVGEDLMKPRIGTLCGGYGDNYEE